ncbi:hypothetical protein EPR50_G00165300 [Perca flavescens]|uniref:WW domain-containing protein n=1 Tax=Perca flavescens TaxID=8167 RepID=A0A484CNX0_PERFV|nr:hypothetical protein EPR50_G00165300 [Perca flavescens]
MSTFGFPPDVHDASPLTAPRLPSSLPAGPAEKPTGKPATGKPATGKPATGKPATGKPTTGSMTTNMADSAVNKKLPVFLDEHKDSDRPRVPGFNPADPVVVVPRPHAPLIAVATPSVPVVTAAPSPSIARQDTQESPIETEEEEEEEERKGDSPKEEESNHIYESIQDLNLDLDALIGGRESPAAPPQPLAPPPMQIGPEAAPLSPVYANVSSLKKVSLPQISVSGPALPPSPPPGPAPSPPGSSSGMISPASPLHPQDGWQVHTDQDSGKVFYFHPVSKQTTWCDPRGATPRRLQAWTDPEGAPHPPSPLLSPAF